MNAPLSRVERLTQQILADRAKLAERAKNKPSRPAREDFDPYSIPYTRVIAGPDPGYLVRTPMRMGPVGFYISCQACGAEFESKGWRYCPTCMEVPAEERRQMRPAVQGRLCEGPGCEIFVPRKARADVRYCSRGCRNRAYRVRRETDNPPQLPYRPAPENETDKPQKSE